MALQKRILASQCDFGTTCDLVTYLLIAKILLLQYNQHFTLTFGSLSETFTRRSFV